MARLGRNYYREGFDLMKWQPLNLDGGRAILKAILPSDYDQVIRTDMINEVQHCKVWELVKVSDGVQGVEKGDHVIILKPAIDTIDGDDPTVGIVDVRDLCAKIERE